MIHNKLPTLASGLFIAQSTNDEENKLNPYDPDTMRADLEYYFVHTSWQEQTRLIKDSRLMNMAQARAEDMVARQYFAHEDPDEKWPNFHVRKHAYKLPENYPNDSNWVESIAAGYTSPYAALQGLHQSPAHHDHVVGSNFWRTHNIFGVGYMPGHERYNHIYVVVTAPSEQIPPPRTELDQHMYLPFIQGGVKL
jgi:hypothetical protein